MVTHAHTQKSKCVTKLVCGQFLSFNGFENTGTLLLKPKIIMSIRKLAEIAPAAPELGKAQPKLVCKYYQIPILLCNIQAC